MKAPTDRRIPRREAIRSLVVLSASFALPGALVACSKKPTCTDVSGLTPEELQLRTGTAAYVEATPDPAKTCDNCAQWTPAPSENACGGCKVVKGPINPKGYCKLWVAKPA
jgi:hypothetical protein